jgi:cell division septum initiation protein DivIVA
MRPSLAVLFFLAAPGLAHAQSPIVSMPLGPDQIGQIKSAQEITTRISFPEAVKEIICGDLYDSTTGKGSFVVQRSDKDVFVKPITSKAMSNLFVKTGEKGEHIYNFDLTIVPVNLAYRVVNVLAPRGDSGPEGGGDGKSDESVRAAEQAANESIRKAREQAGRILDQAQQRATDIKREAEETAAEMDRKAAEQAQHEVEQRFVNALMVGLGEVKIKEAKSSSKKLAFVLDKTLLKFNDKGYLRFTLRNNSSESVSFATISLETGSDSEPKVIPVEVLLNKTENTVTPTESLTGVVVFDLSQVDKSAVLRLVIRDKEKNDIVRVAVIQTV